MCVFVLVLRQVCSVSAWQALGSLGCSDSTSSLEAQDDVDKDTSHVQSLICGQLETAECFSCQDLDRIKIHPMNELIIRNTALIADSTSSSQSKSFLAHISAWMHPQRASLPFCFLFQLPPTVFFLSVFPSSPRKKILPLAFLLPSSFQIHRARFLSLF